ncbi:MAG: thiolase family protein [Proteobacteria bacterium]|nr:thiolase family protein [Pseudomonadota bacterium]
MYQRAEIPYGSYWSTPFAKWQGSLSIVHPIQLAAHVAKDQLAKRDISAAAFDYGVLGITTPQYKSFWGVPWMMGMLGSDDVSGPTIAQACATSARCLQTGAQEIQTENADCALVVCADRTSYTPHIYYPDPSSPGGVGLKEDWIMDNIKGDPWAKVSMVETAENCATKWQVTTAQQHDVVLRRYQQYQDALANDQAFQKRYMVLPMDVPDGKFRRTKSTLGGDEGVFATSKEKLDKLKPVMEDGTVTFGGQTHPADGHTAMVIATEARAREMSTNPDIRIRFLGFGTARVEKAFMPAAPVPAAARALQQAGKTIDQIDAIKTHNPFAVNDVVFAKETGANLDQMNNYGCSLIWGHPNSPTGMRATIELIEELVIRGGGIGLFAGCAAGDSAMALVVEVEQR